MLKNFESMIDKEVNSVMKFCSKCGDLYQTNKLDVTDKCIKCFLEEFRNELQ